MPCSPLAALFDGSRAAETPVAVVAGELRTFEAFDRATAAVAARVEERGGQRWLLALDEAWAFSVGFFGLLRAGRSVAIPPNHLPATLDRLRPQVDGILTELPEPGPQPRAPERLTDASITFWTSGSSGEAKAVEKRLSQLSAEVDLLETTFSHRFAGGPVLGTVPHQHIYGCLFRILWPLAAGRPWVAEPCGDPDRLGHVMAVHPAPALVSSPALLSRLPDLVDLDAFASQASVIFSSGGPLKRADALRWRSWVKEGVAEIYGSTESGGIAWRVQDEAPESDQWTPFPDVTLETESDGAFRVRSFRAGDQPLRMEDALEATTQGRFRLRGRLDRIVKLEEKRLSLPEMEAALESHPSVRQAALVLLEGRRKALGAVVVLNHAVDDETRRTLGQAFRRHLAKHFEAVLLPRRWRFVESLPFDERGKLTVQALAALFATGESCS
ncbi:MAG: AMP-binding protein [Firmicutes bacterium]|nr:AMP-binding protein [Bacillota bacterium]